ncbi:MAG: T9SS type A sorting domain-containing protein, partial [Flavobacteriales bacterium]|nr:T9SS type A sorting domain-containing protein [Flavobacteriales bacterium]
TVDYTNSTVMVEGSLSGGYDTLATVIHSGDNAFVHGWTWCDTYQVLPGTDLSIQAGRHVTAENFDLNGTASEMITISSSSPGEEAFFYKSSGTVEASYLNLTDNHAGGGATFYVSNGVLNDNVEGWNEIVSSLDEIQFESLDIYPNPSSGPIMIEADIQSTLHVLDLSGRMVRQLVLGNGNRQFDLGDLDRGTYVIVGLSPDDELYRSTLVIE